MKQSENCHAATRTMSLISAIMAGGMIGIGGAVFLSCDSRIVGALLFTVGLCTICTFGLHLYTGRVGYMPDTLDFVGLAVVWFGNLIGAVSVGLLMKVAKPEICNAAALLCLAKLSQTFFQILILSMLCGVLMYVAVDTYKRLVERGTAAYIGIVLCVPAFILCGFEHSIADIFYFGAGFQSASQLPPMLLYLTLVSVGNAIGAILFHLGRRFACKPCAPNQ